MTGWLHSLWAVVAVGLHSHVALAVAPPDGNKLIDATLLIDTREVEPGKPFRAGVLLKIEPGWHTYWRDPGDSGVPTDIRWKLPPGFVAGELQWPQHKRFEIPGGLYNNGYDGEVLLFATITPPEKIEDDTVSIGAEVSWLVCTDEQCLPGSATMSQEVRRGEASPSSAEELFDQWSRKVPQSPATQPAR